MDMEQLRKINQLSHELKRHGMAESSTDAYQQAEHIIQVIPKPSAASGSPDAAAWPALHAGSTEGSVVVESVPAEALAARQYEFQLEKIQKTVTAELDVLRNAVNQIISEVNALRDDLGKLQAAPAVAPKPKEKQAELQTPKESHPRQGDYKPGDIDIKSVFYYGTKK